MKYMIMLFNDPTAIADRSPDWIRQMHAGMYGLHQDLAASGELVDGRGLVEPAQAKTVRFAGGVPVTTDGPFAEAKESIAGYWVVEATEERALEIAARAVAVAERPMEVRRVMDEPAPEPVG